MKEVWKKIEGYDLYEVSNFGNIKSLNFNKESILKLNLTDKGYLHVSLFKNRIKKTTSVHRIVAISFIPNPENKPCVNHIDGNKQNNKITNLEWVTVKENIHHSFNLGLNSGKKGEHHNCCKLTEKDVLNIRMSKLKQNKLAEKYLVSQMLISKIKTRKLWKHI